MPSGWCSARVSYTGVSAPGAVACCACIHEAQSRRRQRVPGHTLSLIALVKGCAVTRRCITLAFELDVIIGAPLGGVRAWPDGPALPGAAVLAQAVGVHAELAVVAPDFEQVVEARCGLGTG